MSQKKWRKYPETQPCERSKSTHRSSLCWITVERTDGAHKGERFVSIATLINIDCPGYLTLWEFWINENRHCRTVDHYDSGLKVVAWKPFDIPEPYNY